MAPYCEGYYRQPAWFLNLVNQTGKLQDYSSMPIEVTADFADYMERSESLLEGDVIIRQGTRHIKSDLARLDDKQEVVSLEGNVQVRQPGLLFHGTSGTSNLTSHAGEINDASFLIHEASFRGKADRIHSTDENRISIENGRFTRCEPGSNFWYLNGEDISLLTEKNYGTARNVVIEVKDVPVIYLPYLRFPTSRERASGFLMPSLGHQSDGGTDISAPYYFNLAPHYDATYTPRSIWKRGLLNEGQFRYKTAHSYNVLNAAFLADDNEYDNRTLVENSDGDNLPIGAFEKQDRWLLNIRHSGGWNKRLQSSIRYSVVSDESYLHDLGGDIDPDSIEQYVGGVDHSLTNRRTAALDQLGEITYFGQNWSVAGRLQGFQLLDRTATESYERLPQLTANYGRTYNHIQFHISSEYTYFDRDNDALLGLPRIVGGRYKADAKVSLPARNSWGFFVPSVLMKHRSYDIKDTPAGTDTSPTVSVPGFSVDSGLIFDRSLNINNHELNQTLEPRLYFLWVDEDEQNSLPNFDSVRLTPSFNNIFRDDRFGGGDRVGDARQVSAGITSRVLGNRNGSELIKASLGQIYYFKDREVVLPDDPVGIDNEADRSALYSNLKVSLFENLMLRGNLEWDPKENRTNRGSLSVQYQTQLKQIINLRYSYTSEDVKTISQYAGQEESDISFFWPVKSNWNLLGRWNYGWDNHQTIESLVGIEYNDCCWRARLAFRRYLRDPGQDKFLVPGQSLPIQTLDVEAESGIFFEFQLKGLATVGRKLNSLLNESIIGYREIEESYEH
jgi:LPS-assembly protein